MKIVDELNQWMRSVNVASSFWIDSFICHIWPSPCLLAKSQWKVSKGSGHFVCVCLVANICAATMTSLVWSTFLFFSLFWGRRDQIITLWIEAVRLLFSFLAVSCNNFRLCFADGGGETGPRPPLTSRPQSFVKARLLRSYLQKKERGFPISNHSSSPTNQVETK